MINKFLETMKKSRHDTLSLNKILINLLREYFSLCMQSRMGKLKQLHLIKRSRRDIASLKLYLSHIKDTGNK